MPSSKWAVIVLPLALAVASSVAAQERCTGTLCDFYYGSSPPETPAQPAAAAAAPTPLYVPGSGYLGSLFGGAAPQPAAPGAAPAPPSRIQVQGGGLLGAARGEPAEHCSGTLCDFYYGTSTPWPEDAPAARPAAVAAEPSAEAEAATRTRPPDAVQFVERPEPALCAPRPGDPWSCYRK